MHTVLSLDTHAHLNSARTPVELVEAGAVLATTLGLNEARQIASRDDACIAWGVGCHPPNHRLRAPSTPGPSTS